MTTTQGGKKLAKKDAAVTKPAPRKPRAMVAKNHEPESQKVTRSEAIKESNLESLAMIHHTHGNKFKHKLARRSFFRLTRMDSIIEHNWSLWHLAWSIVWRAVLIVFVVRFLSILTVSLLSNLISTI